ncbi:MAG: 30S ribosomal protein S6 [Clostridia bacterium]|nr:30S ribosomal protein S6 [Clostridia bacterium]MBQ8269116.1 30S ribosomal protein S6 [Clostridia bacterium]
MEKKICSYETMFVISGNLTEEDYVALKDKYVGLIAENATDVAVDEWGKRKLAYTINYINEGYYVLASYKSEPTFPLELERVLGLNENVIRSMTTAKCEKAPKAAAPVAKAEETAEVAEATEE